MKKYTTLASQCDDASHWYSHCKTNNLPQIKVYPQDGAWTVDWDCITLDPPVDKHFSEPEVKEGLLKEIFAQLYPQQIRRLESKPWPLSDSITHLNKAQAKLVAAGIFDLLLKAGRECAELETHSPAQ